MSKLAPCDYVTEADIPDKFYLHNHHIEVVATVKNGVLNRAHTFDLAEQCRKIRKYDCMILIIRAWFSIE
jgi:hypothetical protein